MKIFKNLVEVKIKVCGVCKIGKPYSEFTFRKLKSGNKTLKYLCRDCSKLKARRLRSNPIYKANEHKAQRLNRRNNPEKEMLHRTEQRARKLNLEFNLDLSDIIIPNICPLLEIPLFITIGKAGDNSPSLDRIQPKLGYVKGNVRVISRMANIMKAHASEKQILIFYKNIQSYYQA